MKIAIKNDAVFDEKIGEVGSMDEHFKERAYYLVSDIYNFAANNAIEVTEDSTIWIDKLKSIGRVMKEEEFLEAQTDAYEGRNIERERQLNKATLKLIGYLMQVQLMPQEVANMSVGQLSLEVSQFVNPYIFGIKTPLIAAINASLLSFMTPSAKAYAVSNL